MAAALKETLGRACIPLNKAVATPLRNARLQFSASNPSAWWAPNYPAWQCDYSNFTEGKMHEGLVYPADYVNAQYAKGSETEVKLDPAMSTGTKKLWIPDVTAVEDPLKAQWDISYNPLRISYIFGWTAKHAEVFFGLTIAGYVFFSLYDYRKEAKQ